MNMKRKQKLSAELKATYENLAINCSNAITSFFRGSDDGYYKLNTVVSLDSYPEPVTSLFIKDQDIFIVTTEDSDDEDLYFNIEETTNIHDIIYILEELENKRYVFKRKLKQR